MFKSQGGQKRSGPRELTRPVKRPATFRCVVSPFVLDLIGAELCPGVCVLLCVEPHLFFWCGAPSCGVGDKSAFKILP